MMKDEKALPIPGTSARRRKMLGRAHGVTFRGTVLLCLAALNACHPGQNKSGASGDKPGWTCGFDPTMQLLGPRQLVQEFVARASGGEFATTGEWLWQVVDCPDHEPAYESFDVARRYSLVTLDSGATMARYLLTMDELGSQDARFHRAPRTRTDTIAVVRTQNGWRLRTPTPWNWLTVGSALREGWLSPKDTLPQRP